MKLSYCGSLVASLLLSCTFPEVDLATGGKSSSASATTVSTASSGSVAASSSHSATASSSTGTLGMCQACLLTSKCDCDGDGVERFDGVHGCTNVPMDPTMSDCDDCNFDVHPGQAGFFTMPTSKGGFDYDCNMKDEPEYVMGTCSSVNKPNCSSRYFFQSSPVCGAPATQINCADPGILTNPCMNGTTTINVPAPCH